MKSSHELAKLLMSMPNRDLMLSIDMSVDEDTAGNRAFSEIVMEAQDNGSYITILAESGHLNF